MKKEIALVAVLVDGILTVGDSVSVGDATVTITVKGGSAETKAELKINVTAKA